MNRTAFLSILTGVVAFCGLNTTHLRAAEEKGGQLKSGDYVAVIGDSITEQKQYSVFIEDYLLMCEPVKRPESHAVRLGWGKRS